MIRKYVNYTANLPFTCGVTDTFLEDMQENSPFLHLPFLMNPFNPFNVIFLLSNIATSVTLHISVLKQSAPSQIPVTIEG